MGHIDVELTLHFCVSNPSFSTVLFERGVVINFTSSHHTTATVLTGTLLYCHSIISPRRLPLSGIVDLSQMARRLSVAVIVTAVILAPLVLLHNLWIAGSGLGREFASSTLKKKNEVLFIGKTNALFYQHDRQSFVHQLSSCLFDYRHCRVLNWHIQKTGGSFIASKMYPAFNRAPYKSQEWCCNEDFMSKFRSNSTAFCSKRMGIYEVRPDQYTEVLQTCQQYAKSVDIPMIRYIGFISIREPIQRSVSAIHQRCNVHKSQLPTDIRETCNRCSYDVAEDRPFFESYVNQTNKYYRGLQQLMLSRPDKQVPLYVIDNEDINEMFQSLEKTFTDRLAEHGSNLSFHFPRGKQNAEAMEKLCDFGMPSSLMKNHREALDAYHWVRATSL